jgi:long-chain acyl-CoA synthetase
MSTSEITVPNLFSAKANEFRDIIAFHYFDGEWKSIPYHEFLTTARSIASYLLKNGVRKGDRIAIISENRPEWCEAYLAVSMSGGIAVPIDAQLGPEEIRNLLSDSATRILFHSSITGENVKKISDKVSPNQQPSPVRINFEISPP